MQFIHADAPLHLGDVLCPLVRQQLPVLPHQLVRNLHYFPEHLLRRLGDPDVVPQRLRHLVHAIDAFEKGCRAHDLRRLPEIPLEFPSHQQIEFLIRPAQLDIAFQHHRIVRLSQRVQQLVHRNRRAFLVSLGEIVTLQNAGHRVAAGEPHHIVPVQGLQPLAVVPHFGFRGIENLEYLRLVSFGIGLHLLAGHRRTGRVAA